MVPPTFAYRLITFDVDGTLTRGHGWQSIARATGQNAQYRESNRSFLAGERDEHQHLKELLQLAVGLTIPEMERLLASTPKVGGIAETIAAFHERGARVALLTHNPEYVVDWYRRTFGFDDGEGTANTVIRDGRIVDAGPATPDKLGGLQRLLERYHAPPGEAAHVGDGWADVAVFRQVGAGVAFNSGNPDVERAADRALHSEDLRALVPVLESLQPRRV